jgi:hypothetical protein
MIPSPRLEKLRAAFDTLLIREVERYGGIPVYHGRCGEEQMALREAIAELLDAVDPVVPPPDWSPDPVYAATSISPVVPPPAAPDAPYVNNPDYVECWQSGWRAGYAAALAGPGESQVNPSGRPVPPPAEPPQRPLLCPFCEAPAGNVIVDNKDYQRVLICEPCARKVGDFFGHARERKVLEAEIVRLTLELAAAQQPERSATLTTTATTSDDLLREGLTRLAEQDLTDALKGDR